MTRRPLKCCLYRTPDGSADQYDPYRNLAVEEFLVQYLADHIQDDMAILYLWRNADCVVFGRNQNPSSECRLDLMKEKGVCPVRRKTGGGAVFHDLQNLNFSFIVPKRHYDRDASMQIVVRTLQACGIDAAVNGRNDIVAGNCKVSGNAYLSHQDVCLHHGTLLIGADMEKMEALLTVDAGKFAGRGIRSVRSRVRNLNEIMPALAVKDYEDALGSSFLECYAGSRNAGFDFLELDGNDMERIRQLREEYASQEWIFGHETGRIWQKGSHFDWGNCLVQCTDALKHTYALYSDTLHTEDFEQVRKRFACQETGEPRVNELYGKQKKMFEDICNFINEVENGNSV